MFGTAKVLELNEEAEQLAGLLYNSLIDCGGNVVRVDIEVDRTFDYVVARQKRDFAQVGDVLEHPDEVTTVLFKAAILFDLDEVFDLGLWELDGHALSAYVTDDFSEFAKETMSAGQNIVWLVGHDIFRVRGLGDRWPKTTPAPESRVQVGQAIAASLLFPDRVPWFALEQQLESRA